jgi:hypothetical protein
MYVRLVAILMFALFCYLVSGEDMDTAFAMVLMPLTALISFLVLSRDA